MRAARLLVACLIVLHAAGCGRDHVGLPEARSLPCDCATVTPAVLSWHVAASPAAPGASALPGRHGGTHHVVAAPLFDTTEAWRAEAFVQDSGRPRLILRLSPRVGERVDRALAPLAGQGAHLVLAVDGEAISTLSVAGGLDGWLVMDGMVADAGEACRIACSVREPGRPVTLAHER